MSSISLGVGYTYITSVDRIEKWVQSVEKAECNAEGILETLANIPRASISLRRFLLTDWPERLLPTFKYLNVRHLNHLLQVINDKLVSVQQRLDVTSIDALRKRAALLQCLFRLFEKALKEKNMTFSDLHYNLHSSNISRRSVNRIFQVLRNRGVF